VEPHGLAARVAHYSNSRWGPLMGVAS
jgi:hypothetical protein